MYSICVNDKFLPLLSRVCLCVLLVSRGVFLFFPLVIVQYIPVTLRHSHRSILSRRVEEAQDDFVHGKHHCRARNRAHEVRRQAAVEAHEAFLLPDELEALDQAGVLELAVSHGGLSQTRSSNLDKVALVGYSSPQKFVNCNLPRVDRQ